MQRSWARKSGAELEQRRDSDESEQRQSIWTQQEIALRRWIEIRETLTEPAAAPAETPPDLSPAQPAREERIFFLPGISFLWEAPDAWVDRAAEWSKSEGKGMPMSWMRIALAALGAFVAYFVVGGLLFAVLPWLKTEFMKYPAVYRSQEGIKSLMPAGMAAMFVSMVVLALIYAMIYGGGAGVMEGARFGALIGVFAMGAFTVHNFVNLNIGLKLTVGQSVAYFVEWVVVGIVIGVIYRPA